MRLRNIYTIQIYALCLCDYLDDVMSATYNLLIARMAYKDS